MKLLGQAKKELFNIPASTKHILWLNLSAPSLGDSLMDLSARQMLKDFNVDLLTDAKNIGLYQADPFFQNVYDDVDQLPSHYDLIILDAYSPRILKIKALKFPDIPFVGMWGFLNGFEVHRTLYSFYRMQFLLNAVKPALKLSPVMRVPDFFDAGLDPKKKKIAIVVGAEWQFRRYGTWLEVVAGVVQEYGEEFELVLLGSSNGSTEAKNIKSAYPQVNDFVGKCSLNQTASLIQQSNLIIVADGGLWHIACALDKPSVVLFADTMLFDQTGLRVTRETQDICCEALYADKSVAEIKPEKILYALKKLLNKMAI